MDIQTLRYFVKTAEIGNLSRAALELHVSQPTLTVNIKKLEDELGILLFERSKKGVILTAAGKDTLLQTQEILQNWENLKNTTSSSKNEVKGSFILGVHPSVGCYTLPKLLPALVKKYPEVKLNLVHDLSRNILSMIQMHSCDVGLVINPQPHADLIIKELLQDEVKVWRKKGSKNNQLLLMDDKLFQSQTIIERLKKKKIFYPQTICSTSLEVIAKLLDSGVGHALLPERVARQVSDIEEAQPSIAAFKDSLCLVYRSHFRKTPLGKAFIELVADQKL